jgi:Kyakuja-Dileera-Zisupton transposase
LELFDSLEIIGAVGKWHLAAHILECFPRFSLNFVKGTGEVDGEILDTLWSPLDEVAGLTQAMSIPHAQEVIDDHMHDSNWWKIIRMRRDRHHMHFYLKLILFLADSLCAKRSQATKWVSEMKPAFEQLTECLDASLVRDWTEQERVAMEQRGDHLKIYEVISTKCKQYLNSSLDTDRLCLSVPTLVEIQLKLSETEVQHGNLSGSVSIITEGLAIEKSQ